MEVIAKYNTLTKKLEVTIDGNPVDSVSYLSFGCGYYDEQDVACMILEQRKKDKATGVTYRHTTEAMANSLKTLVKEV